MKKLPISIFAMPAIVFAVMSAFTSANLSERDGIYVMSQTSIDESTLSGVTFNDAGQIGLYWSSYGANFSDFDVQLPARVDLEVASHSVSELPYTDYCLNSTSKICVMQVEFNAADLDDDDFPFEIVDYIAGDFDDTP